MRLVKYGLGGLSALLVVGLMWVATGHVVKSGLNHRINQASLNIGKG